MLLLHNACATILHLSAPAPAPRPWRFDVTSALIGAAVALLLAGLTYRYRFALRRRSQALVAPLVRLSTYLRASAEERYCERVARWARSRVVPPGAISLDEIFVEPALLVHSPIPQSLSELELEPARHQALPLSRTLGGHPLLAIVGAPGLGKTTALAYIALTCARELRGEESDAKAETAWRPLQGRLPLYLLLPAMDWSEPDRTGEWMKDRPDRLLRAAMAAVGGSGEMLGPLRQRLQAGQAVVLADGWEELSSLQRQQAATWLAELAHALPENLWLASAEDRGYAPLTEAGFVALRLVAWDAGRVEAFARQWVGARSPAGESQATVLRKLVAELQRVARSGAPPLELALRAWVALSNGQAPARRAALFDRALDLLLVQEQEPWVPDACRKALGQLALSMQQEGQEAVNRQELDAAVESALPPPEERPARAATHTIRALAGPRGLLRPVGPDRYAFVHPLWRAHLVACQLVAVDPASLTERLDDPRWADALRFYAELGDMGPLVAAWLRGPDDMFHSRLHVLSTWIRVAPQGAAWRDGAMAVLARSFLQPGCPLQVRQALAQALAATGVPGITYLFKQAIKHPHPEVRVAATLGLARTAGEADLPAIGAALQDEAPAVRETAVRELAHVGLDAATRWLAQIVLTGDETLGPIAAEALAECGAEGLASLREAIGSEDVMARRAAVYGLARVKVRDVLEQAAREDAQWIVRSAATMALDELERQEKVSGVPPPPEIEQLPWLISWAAAQYEGVGVGDAARRMLLRALSGADAPARLASALVLAQIGRPDDVEPLRTALADPDLAVAGAALEALAEIERRYVIRQPNTKITPESTPSATAPPATTRATPPSA